MPLIDDFICSSAKTKAFEESDNEPFMGLGMCTPCEDEPPDLSEQHGSERAIRCCTSVMYVTNQNLGGAQKELLFWHHKLCINMIDLQLLVKPQSVKDQE